MLSTSSRMLSYILLSRLSPYTNEIIGIISVGFDVTNQLLIRFSTFIRYWWKKWEYSEAVHQLFTAIKKAYDSVRKEVLYSILIRVWGYP
jgi:hypothetical protein